jgi:hypothetical protein
MAKVNDTTNGKQGKSVSAVIGEAGKDAKIRASRKIQLPEPPDGSAKDLQARIPEIAPRIELPKLDIRTLLVPLVGTSPLICHRWSVKAKTMLLNKQMGKASQGRAHKVPDNDFAESLYVIRAGKDPIYGFPAIAFKACAVTSCTSMGKLITKVQARQAFHVEGLDDKEMVTLEGTPTKRDDTVRIGAGIADIRFRGEFKEWKCVLRIRYNTRVMSRDQVVNLYNTAGFGVGVGEWRPECDGQYGRFEVDMDRGIVDLDENYIEK